MNYYCLQIYILNEQLFDPHSYKYYTKTYKIVIQANDVS